MAVVKQFCVGIENKPGMLTRLCDVLSRAGVNIVAIFVTYEADTSWVNFVATPVDTAMNVLEEHKYKFFTEPVLSIRCENRPGEIQRIAGKLADKGVNINYVYGSGAEGVPSTIVLSVEDLEVAARALAD